jgi:hypothetical protein
MFLLNGNSEMSLEDHAIKIKNDLISFQTLDKQNMFWSS